MLKFLHSVSVLLGSMLSYFVVMAVLSCQAIASPKPELVTSICYMTLPDGRTVDLSQLCKKTLRKAGDSPNSLISPKQNADRAATIDDLYFDVSLDDSPKKRALRKQAEALNQRLAQTKDGAEIEQIVKQLMDLEHQITKLRKDSDL